MRSITTLCLVLGMFLIGWSPQAQAAPKAIKLMYIQNDGDQMDVIAKKAKAYIEEKTNGKYRIDLLCCSKMGSEEAMVTAIRTGVVPMALLTCPGYADAMMNVTTLPYIIKDIKHFYDVFEGPVGKEIGEHFSKATGVSPKVWYYRIHQMIFTSKPLLKPEDWPKFKIRTAAQVGNTCQVEAMGGHVVPLPFTEVYMALKTGVVDGVQTVMDWFVSFKLYEACKYAIDIKHDFSPMAIYFNDKFSASLPSEDYEIFVEAFARQKEENETWVDENYKRYYQKMVDEGVTITEASEEDITLYSKQCQEFIRKNADLYGGIEIYEKMIKAGGF